MTQMIVNVVLLLAIVIVIVILVASSLRRRRADLRRENDERSLILQTFVGAATQPPAPSTPQPTTAPPNLLTAAPVTTPPRQRPPLDVESVAALLDLLEGRRPTRRGLVTSLISSPRSIWSAGETAGRQAGQRTLAGLRSGPAADTSGDLYRDAAGELVEIHGYDPRDAHEQYQRYAAAIGDPAFAELYVRSAAHNAYPENPGHVAAVVDEITSTVRPQDVTDARDVIEL